MRHARTDDAEAPGNDSFLDIVANMVGIMILLVMVVGLRVTQKSASPPAEPQVANETIEPATSEEELASAIRSAMVTKNEVQELSERMVAARYDAALRERERNLMVEYVAAFEQELDARRAELNEQQQRDLEARRNLAEAETLLDQLTVEHVSLLSQPTDVEVITHQPTPIARQLDGQEVFLHLANGHVAMVPVKDLMDEFQEEAKRNLWRLRDEDRVVGRVGPIGQFRLRYFIRKRNVVAQGQHGSMRGVTMPVVEKCEIIPTKRPVGEPVHQAIRPGSELRQWLQGFRPESTAVMITLYSDSISEHHTLKKAINELGFSVGEQMPPDGQPLTFSPDGEKVFVQ